MSLCQPDIATSLLVGCGVTGERKLADALISLRQPWNMAPLTPLKATFKGRDLKYRQSFYIAMGIIGIAPPSYIARGGFM